jgi:hypothetical protein
MTEKGAPTGAILPMIKGLEREIKGAGAELIECKKDT